MILCGKPLTSRKHVIFCILVKMTKFPSKTLWIHWVFSPGPPEGAFPALFRLSHVQLFFTDFHKNNISRELHPNTNWTTAFMYVSTPGPRKSILTFENHHFHKRPISHQRSWISRKVTFWSKTGPDGPRAKTLHKSKHLICILDVIARKSAIRSGNHTFHGNTFLTKITILRNHTF